MGGLSVALLALSLAMVSAGQTDFIANIFKGMGTSYGFAESEDHDVYVDQPETDEVLPYCSSHVMAQKAFGYINKKMNFKDPSPAQRSMIAVIMTLNAISGVVGHGLDFNTAYAAAPALLTLGENYPNVARDITLATINEINDKMEPIDEIYNKEMAKLGGKISPAILEKCDKEVDAIVRKNPSLQGPGALVLEIGKLGKDFNSRTSELEKIAKRQAHKTVFTFGKKFLKPLIMKQASAVEIIKTL